MLTPTGGKGKKNLSFVFNTQKLPRFWAGKLEKQYFFIRRRHR